MEEKSQSARTNETPRSRRDGFRIMVVCAAIYFLAGLVFLQKAPYALTDFKVVYYSARCLAQHGDPYAAGEIESKFDNKGRLDVPGYPVVKRVITNYFYPPTTFSITAPMALLPYSVAALLWTLFSALLFAGASFVLWELASEYSPIAAGFLVGYALMNSVWLLMCGNSASLAIALCILSVWTFIRRRHERAGVIALAISLVLKPHIAGLVWLYFLVSRSGFRKRALQALACSLILAIPSVLWTTAIAPHWYSEMRANLARFADHGDLDDPGLDSHLGRDIEGVVGFQAIVSVMDDNPAVHNAVTYVLFGAMLLLCLGAAVRSRGTLEGIWLGLACIFAITMIPVYHRVRDTKLIVLCVPAWLVLWKTRGFLGWTAMLLISAAIALNGDMAETLRILFVEPHVHYHAGWMGDLLAVILGRPAQLSLFLLGVFYLIAFELRIFSKAFGQRLSEDPAAES
jgi:Glycosyltransferase family 87